MAIEIRRRPAGAALDFAPELHPVLRRVYAARGIAQADDLDLSLDRLLPVRALDHVERAAELLAAHRSGRVLIVGDFDADGATGSALFVRALRALKFAHVDFLVPNRFLFGYGLTPGIVALAAERAPSLIVTVDNGVSSIEGVETARAFGIPVLVTDHHLPGGALPPAEVIVNPNLADSTFPSRALAGVGVAFYVVAALAHLLGEKNGGPPICWISWPWARSPIWCRSIAITACWWRRACGAFEPVGVCPASVRWSSRPGGGSSS